MSEGRARPGVPYAFRTVSPSRRLCPVIPWVLGKAPVPMVACAHAVTAGKDPVMAFR